MTPNTLKTNPQSGAAMLGIVLVIVVILLALVGALAIGPQLQNITTERKTVKRANVIVDAVKQYYLARGELPEPSSVPVDKLNLEQEYKYDAWGQAWCYYRATQVVGGERITDITGIEVDTGSGNGLDVAGVLISRGPDQEFGSTLDGTASAMTVCPDDGDDIDSITKGGDDIVIPLNVQGEAIQIAKDELGVLTGRGCPVDPNNGKELEGNPVDDPERDEDYYDVLWGAFLSRTGLGTSFQHDPWIDGDDNDRQYFWEWEDEPKSGRWLSLGPPGGNQELRSRVVQCDNGNGPEPEPVPAPSMFIDFGGTIHGGGAGSHYEYNGLVIQLGGPGSTFSSLPSACPGSASDGMVPAGIKSTGSLCLYFNGISDFLWVTDDDYFNPGDPDDGFSEFTLAAWMRAEEQNAWAKLISRRSGSTFYFLGANNSSSINVYPYGAVGDGSGWTKVPPQGSSLYTGTGTLNLDFEEWYHVAVTYDGSDLKFYLNGDLIDTQASSHDLVELADTKLLIGADGPHNAPYHFYRGYMADPVMWKEALSEGQIEQIYQGNY